MDKKTKKGLLFIAFGIIFYALVMNITTVWGFFGKLVDLVFPVMLGFILAFIFNVPMKGFKKLAERIFRNAKRRPPESAVNLVCVILVFLLVAFFFWLILILAIPSLEKTAGDIVESVEGALPMIDEFCGKYGIDWKSMIANLGFINYNAESGEIAIAFDKIATPIFTTITQVLTTTVNVIFALVVCAYALLYKAEIKKNVRRLGFAVLPAKLARKFGYVYDLVRDTYSKFLTAQCIEACILGTMMFLAFLVFRIPYAGLTAVLTALFAFLPYVGAFGSCAIGAFLTLVAEGPEKAILCIVVYTIVQFTENQFIYPHVVGNSVGLSPVWTLIAALVGGSLMGLFGMIFFIPLASVLYTLLGQFTKSRLAKRNIVIADGYESFPEEYGRPTTIVEGGEPDPEEADATDTANDADNNAAPDATDAEAENDSTETETD